MKAFGSITFAFFLAAVSLKGAAVENTPAPDLDTILQRVMDRAKLENENDHSFKQLYTFSREKVNEVHNLDGDLLKHEVKDSTHQLHTDVPTPIQPKPTGTPRDQHPALQGQTFDKNELLNPDTINRFDFTLVGKDVFNGRNMYLVDFAPKKGNLPEHTIKDRFVNKASGRVWVDAQDYTIAKADLQLMKPVDVGFGLFSARKFTYSFERNRTEEGFWFMQYNAWHLESREGIFNRVRDHSETLSNVTRATSVATATR